MAGNYITGALVTGGELVISLDDGRLINCGLVQGPPGLKGPIGPTGPSGRDGERGNGFFHGPGAPRPEIGETNDFYYRTDDPAVYGPKTGSGWGSPVYLKPKGTESSTGQRYNRSDLKGSSGGGRFLMGGGPMMIGTGGQQTAGLDPITGNMQPLAAATPTVIAGDTSGYVFHVLLHAVCATGSYYCEVVATRDEMGNTGQVVAWECSRGTTAPDLTFTTAINGNMLELSVSSNINVDLLRGKIIYV